MKTPTARKLPSGAWTCRVRVGGKDVSITRPTEKAAIAEAMAIKAGISEAAKASPCSMTIREAIDDYIASRSAVLSPSTIRGYRIIQDHRFPTIMDRSIKSLSDMDFQKAVNADARSVSAKTIKNAWGFISSVMKDVAGRSVSVRLPQVVPQERPFLQPEEVLKFLSAIRGHRYELPILFGLHGLRASEIFALCRKDIDLRADSISVNGAAVPDEHMQIVRKKETKNVSSRRTIRILIPRLKELMLQVEAAPDAPLFPNLKNGALYNAIGRICTKNDLPRIGPHGLRHSFASLCYHLGIPEAVTMKLGGWSNPGTMRKIYTHLSDQDLSRDSGKLLSFFQSQIDNENDNEIK